MTGTNSPKALGSTVSSLSVERSEKLETKESSPPKAKKEKEFRTMNEDLDLSELSAEISEER